MNERSRAPTGGDTPPLASFLDADGRVTRRPREARARETVLRYLAAAFEPGRGCTEANVNAAIDDRTRDGERAPLRREMFERGILDREPDGSRYRRGSG